MAYPGNVRPRPHYEATSPLPPDEVAETIRRALGVPGAICVGVVSKRHLDLHIAERDRHVWSPWISVEVEAEGTGSRLKGTFGPNPWLWGVYTGLYAAQVFLFIAGVMYGWICWTLDMPLTGLWVAGATIASLTVSCATNIAGEWAGAPQMAVTRRFLAEALHLEDPGVVTVGAAGPEIPA